jgi:hypothetical protein
MLRQALDSGQALDRRRNSKKLLELEKEKEKREERRRNERESDSRL